MMVPDNTAPQNILKVYNFNPNIAVNVSQTSPIM